MAWVILVIAGICETAWVVTLKYSHVEGRLWIKLLAFGISLLSFLLMERALAKLPVGVSYAIWTGIGAVGAAVLGMLLFKEQPSLVRLGCIAVILAGIIGLRLTTAAN